MFQKNTCGKTTAFFHSDDIFVVDRKAILMLREAMKKDPKGKARICLHKNHKDAVQEMIIASKKTNYVRPHRHKYKTESYHIIEGKMLAVFFDNNGKVIRRVILEPMGGKQPFLLRIDNGVWHTNMSLSGHIIFYEILQGPFNKHSAEFAPWSPGENDEDKQAEFMKHLKS